jgi:hypothetical protein
MDINVEATRGGGGGGGFSGETPCPYPTREYNAVEMSSAIEVSRDRIVTKDTFYGEDGKVVAGAGVTSDSSGIEWRRHDSDVPVRRDETGLVQIILSAAEDEATPVEGANVYVHYSGWLENGQMFDSSRSRPAYRFVWPGMFIAGWSQALTDMGTGARRKLIIPPELGYGDRGDIRQIPPNSTLIFDVEMLKIELPQPQEGGEEGEGGENQPAGADNTGGGGNDATGGGAGGGGG